MAAKQKKNKKLLESPTIMRPKKERFSDRFRYESTTKEMTYNPEGQKPTSEAYRKNYDDIFRHKKAVNKKTNNKEKE